MEQDKIPQNIPEDIQLDANKLFPKIQRTTSGITFTTMDTDQIPYIIGRVDERAISWTDEDVEQLLEWASGNCDMIQQSQWKYWDEEGHYRKLTSQAIIELYKQQKHGTTDK